MRHEDARSGACACLSPSRRAFLEQTNAANTSFLAHLGFVPGQVSSQYALVSVTQRQWSLQHMILSIQASNIMTTLPSEGLSFSDVSPTQHRQLLDSEHVVLKGRTGRSQQRSRMRHSSLSLPKPTPDTKRMS